MKEIIEKAVDGGWKYQNNQKVDLTVRRNGIKVYLNDPDDGRAYVEFKELVLDPLFWQALGKACGWGNSFGFIQTSDTGRLESWLEADATGTVYQWEYRALRFHEINLTESWDAAVVWLSELVINNK